VFFCIIINRHKKEEYMRTSKVNYFTMVRNYLTPVGQAANFEIIDVKLDSIRTPVYQRRLPNKHIALSYQTRPAKNVVENTVEIVSSRGLEAIKTTTLTKLTNGEPAQYLQVITKKFIDSVGNVVRTLTKQRFIK
jgi:hypothetical protein